LQQRQLVFDLRVRRGQHVNLGGGAVDRLQRANAPLEQRQPEGGAPLRAGLQVQVGVLGGVLHREHGLTRPVGSQCGQRSPGGGGQHGCQEDGEQKYP
jgi:hypothetical protein